MLQLDQVLEYAEAHRTRVFVVSAVLIMIVAAIDWKLPGVSIAFLYVVPMLISAAAMNRTQIVSMAVVCGYLRAALDPLQGKIGSITLQDYNPLLWTPINAGRGTVAFSGFALTGFFVVELNRRRRLLVRHLQEIEREMKLRKEAESHLKALVETSPLAILTLSARGTVRVANDSARQLLGFESDELYGESVEPYLPILTRMLARKGQIRTSVECKGRRRNGEVFLAHVWLSTYQSSSGQSLAALIWDASENLRDREGAGLDSMMATSRVLVGALSHEIRNLASAASVAVQTLGGRDGVAGSEEYEALVALVDGLAKIAASGLRMGSTRRVAASDLGTVLDEARIVLDPTLQEAGISVEWTLTSGLPLVQADHHSLLQVFINLVHNARAALEHAERKHLHVSTGIESDLVVVRFEDSGPGVTHPEQLFRPFQPGAQSSGLGLYVSRAILRSHGGGLRYEPLPEGCRFVVELWPVEGTKEA
jgi:two-component system, LuxR family, sensor kinase FixL